MNKLPSPSRLTLPGRRFAFALCGLFALGAGIVPVARGQTATVVQSTPFNFSISGTESGTGSSSLHVISPAGALTTTFNPFDGSLGTLESFTIEWHLTVAGSIGSPTGLSLGVTGDSNFYVGGIQYGGTGSGSSGSSSASFGLNNVTTYLVSRASIDYDPAILPVLTGSSDVELKYGTATTMTVSDYFDGETYEGSNIGTVTLTYTYTPTAVPEPATYALWAGAAMLSLVVVRRRRLV